MPADSEKLEYAIAYLRRTKSIAQITELANLVGAALIAGKTKITITNSGGESGNAGGQIEFEAMLTGQACEALLRQAERAGITDTSAKVPPTAKRLFQTVALGGRTF